MDRGAWQESMGSQIVWYNWVANTYTQIRYYKINIHIIIWQFCDSGKWGNIRINFWWLGGKKQTNKQTNKQTKTMIFTNCPVKAQSEAIVEKIHFSSPCHWNRKFLHLGILKIVYLITKLQNTGDFGYVVSVNLSFGKYLWELFSLSERQWGTKDVITMLLTSFHFIHQCWLNT